MASGPASRRLVFISGYPGSGKSTLAARLASRLGFPLVSKDAILLEIFTAQALPVHEMERAGKAAWAVFWHMARRFPQAVLDTNIKSGSAVERAELAKVDGRVIEVRCVCLPCRNCDAQICRACKDGQRGSTFSRALLRTIRRVR